MGLPTIDILNRLNGKIERFKGYCIIDESMLGNNNRYAIKN